MISFDAKVAQGGIAAGTAFLWSAPAARGQTEPVSGSAQEECARLDAAVEELDRRLSARGDRAGRTEAQLIEAQRLILHDESFTGYARSLIMEGAADAAAQRQGFMDAVQALEKAKETLCEKLISSGNAYIMERCEDIRGMAGVLAGILSGSQAKLPGSPCILVGEELSPSDLTMVEPELILGILTETGSPTSHVSVLAGNLGVPYLYGVGGLRQKLQDGDYLILDAGSGSVCVNPPVQEREAAEKKQEDARKAREALRAQSAALTTKTKICANITGSQETEALFRSGADGVGLFRSEFLLLGREDAPTEDEQFSAYQQVVRAMAGKEVVIRTMDIGSDKQAKWLPLPAEINPALGLRGLRLSLEHRELFRTQLRALLRAAVFGCLKIMVPMVTAEWEVDEVIREIQAAASELENGGVPYRIPELGVMIETPAAVMIASDLAKKVRFFSIGTNDLTQYSLALDREAKGLDRFYDPLHEAVFAMIGMTVRAAHDHGITAAVCGELGSNPEAVQRLIGLGVDELSVSVGKLAEVRRLAADAEKQQEALVTGGQPAAGMPEKEGIKAPADGELIPMEEIPDEVFSSGMMGECAGILPTDGTIYAPITGTVVTVAKTGHAISFRNPDTQILVHVGLDTVKLNGEGFTVRVSEGQTVKQGQPVMEADLDLIRRRGYNPMVIVVRLGTEERDFS